MIQTAFMLFRRLYMIRLRWPISYASRQFEVSSALLYKLLNDRTYNPTLKTMTRIADVLAVPLDHLIGREITTKKPERAETLPSYFITHDFNKLMKS